MKKKDNQKNHCKPRGLRRYSDAVEPRCTPIPEDGYHEPCHSSKKTEPNDRSEYDENGHIVLQGEDGPIKIIPERVDF